MLSEALGWNVSLYNRKRKDHLVYTSLHSLCISGLLKRGGHAVLPKLVSVCLMWSPLYSLSLAGNCASYCRCSHVLHFKPLNNLIYFHFTKRSYVIPIYTSNYNVILHKYENLLLLILYLFNITHYKLICTIFEKWPN